MHHFCLLYKSCFKFLFAHKSCFNLFFAHKSCFKVFFAHKSCSNVFPGTDNDSNYFRSRRVGYNTYMRFGRNGAQTVNRPNPSLIFSQQEHVPFLRFRRQGLDPLIRKGRQPSFPFLRFGRQGPFPIIRFGRQEPDLGSKFLEPRSNLFLRNEKTFPYMRFGKRNFPYLRFGRSYPLNRAEVPELYLGYEDPLDESLGPDFDLDVLRR